MLSLLACVVGLQTLDDSSIRLRTICPSGAVVLVEKMPKEPMISVQLWASSRNVPETKATHGFRHLLEHILVKGRDKGIDKRLESEGCFLHARTFRDAMQIEINVGPRQLDLALKTINELLKPVEVTQEEIDKEVGVMAEEFATYDDASRLSAGAWNKAYGESGLDPFGDRATLKTCTPDALKSLQRKHFYPENLALVVAGPVEVAEATKLATEIVGTRQGGVKTTVDERPAGTPGRIEVDGFGEGRAAMVPSFDSPTTMASLACALSMANEVDGSFVTYTPSTRAGLVIVGQTERSSGMGLKIDAIKEGELPRYFQSGRYLARTWVERQLRTASGVAYLRGLLLCQGAGFRPEQMLSAIQNMTYDQFAAAKALYAKDKSVTVVGI